MLVQSRHVLALGFRIAPIDVDENPVAVGRSFRASRSFRWRFESCLFREMSRSLVEETGHGRAGAGSVRDFSHGSSCVSGGYSKMHERRGIIPSLEPGFGGWFLTNQDGVCTDAEHLEPH